MTKNFYSYLLGVSLLVAGSAQLAAQPGSDRAYDLLFTNGTLKPAANTEAFLRAQAPAADQVAQGVYFRLLQFWQIPSAAQRKSLEAAGVQLHQYMPHHAYFASLPVNVNKSVLASAGVRAVLEIEPAQKLSANLMAQDYPAWAMRGENQIELVLQYYPSLSAEAAIALLQQKQVQVTGRNDYSQQLTVQVPVSGITALARVPFVSYIEVVEGPAAEDNLVEATSHRSNTIATEHPMGRKYNGQGVVVAMGDGGRINYHIDYQGRYTVNTTNAVSTHSEHVGGTIMGAGNLDPRAKGMAAGAHLLSYYYGAAISSAPTTYNSLNVRLTSNSWSAGGECNVGYNSSARTIDQQVRQMPSLMHVFSAGNTGADNCGYGAGSGWGNINGGYKQGKNILAVANLTYTDGLAGSSARGPAKDGRIKPDISGVGTNVYSTVNPQTYTTMTGTSMSTPGLAGTLAQLIHAYRELHSGTDPASALIKAVVLNTADDIGNPGPDYKHGFGRVNALRAVRALENESYVVGTATQGSADTHTLTVPAGTREIRVMVYWADYEAASNAAIALVNNLDMQVTDPSATVYNPWVLNPTANVTALNSNAVRAVDNLNNVEQVTISDPAAGTYTITVNGTTVPQGPQTYYLIYTFVGDEIELTYPIGGEGFVPSQQETIRWDAYGNTGNFTLEYSVDSGANWNVISSTISGSARYHNWIVAPTVVAAGKALMRISRGTTSDVSDATFTIIRTPANISFAYICPDSLKLQWAAVNGAVGYQIHRLGTQYMDSIGTTTATSFVVHNTNPAVTDWFSVKAITADGGHGRRANAVKKPLGSLNCVIAEVALLGITSPVSGCYSSSSSPLCVSIQNQGNSAITNIPLGISIDNANPVIHNVPGPIAAGSTLNYCFPAGIYTFPTSGPVTITADIAYPGDINQNNNQQSVTVTLNQAPVPAISYSSAGTSYTFTSGLASAATYAWSFGDGNTSALASPAHTFAAGGTYTVSLQVTDSNGCIGADTLVVSVVSGLGAEMHSLLRLYPNPSPGQVMLEWDANAGEQAWVEVSTLHGQVLKREAVTSAQHRLDLSRFADGAYLVKLTNERVSAVNRIMLQH